jgi:hypothetical protein
MPPGCTSSNCVTTLGGGFLGPVAVAVDGSGNVYVADYVNNAVKEMPPGCASSSCVTTLGGGFDLPWGAAVDGSGNVYVADTYNNEVKEIPAGCTSSNFSSGTCAITTLGGGFLGPIGVAVDGSGNVYVAHNDNYAVYEMPPGCTSANYASSVCTIITLGQVGIYAPYGVAVDSSDNVYVAYPDFTAVQEIMPHGVNFGSVAVGATGPVLTLYFTFTTGGSGITASVLTQGATGLDFADAGGGTCDTNGTSYAYSTGDTCSVNVSFLPKHPGPRYGAVNLLNGSGGVIATAYLYGTGTGPQIVYSSNRAQIEVGTASYLMPTGVAVDASGNVYLADSPGQVLELLAAGGYSNANEWGIGDNLAPILSHKCAKPARAMRLR